MRRHGVLVVVLALVAACGSDQDPTLEIPQATSTSAAPSTDSGGGAATATYRVVLSGDAVVPGPGDPDGAGKARVTLVPERSEVCYSIEVEGLEGEPSAHLHRGAAGAPGDVVLDVSPKRRRKWKGCAAADQVLVEELASSPSGFYLQVHAEGFPDGALRGQLG